MTVEEVKRRLRWIWQLGQTHEDGDRRRHAHQSLANDFVYAIATDQCPEPKRCAKLILLPVGAGFYHLNELDCERMS